MFRMGFWFLKWGTIIGALIAGVGWMMGAASSSADVGRFSVASTVSGVVMDMINGQSLNAAGGPRSTRSRSRNTNANKARPKPWHSFAQHQDWQYQEKRAAKDDGDVQQILKDVVSSAEKIVTDSVWWAAAKHAIGFDTGDEEAEQSASIKQAKTKGSTSR